MSKLFLTASLSMLVALGLALTGCTNQKSSDQPPASSNDKQDVPEAGEEGHEGHEHGEGGEQGEHEEALSELSAADRALAEKQKICPVSGQPLGSMGKPHKVTVQGREVFLCCAGCEDKIKADPEKYLAKLPE